jgi:hypothetical protein
MDPHRLTALLESVTDFAKLMIREAGAFYPFGGFLAVDGQVVDDGVPRRLRRAVTHVAHAG